MQYLAVRLRTSLNLAHNFKNVFLMTLVYSQNVFLVSCEQKADNFVILL